MPAKSKAQQRLMAMALHSPGKVRNRSVLEMNKSDLRDYAETKHKGLPKHKRRHSKLMRKMMGK